MAVSVHVVRLNVSSRKVHINFSEAFYSTLDILLLPPDQDKYACLSSAAPVISAWCQTALFCHCYYGEPALFLLLLLTMLIRIVDDLVDKNYCPL